jgi:hypothetical protein
LGSSAEVHRGLSNRGGGGLAVQVRNTVSTATGAVRVRVVTLESIGVSVLAAGGLGNIRHDLHAAGDSTSRTTAASGVGGCCGTAVTLGKLLNQCDGNVVSSDVYGVGNTEDDEGTLGGQRKTGIGGVQTGTGGLLDLTDTAATLSDDGADENVGN